MLKKLNTAIVLFIAFSPLRAMAQIFNGSGNNVVSDTQKGIDDIKDSLQGSGITSTDSISDLILKYVNFALPFLALAAFLAFIYAGFLYVTSYGNEDQIGKSKKAMIFAVVGLVVVIISYSVVRLFTEGLVGALNQP